jgi:hypothetical protein
LPYRTSPVGTTARWLAPSPQSWPRNAGATDLFFRRFVEPFRDSIIFFIFIEEAVRSQSPARDSILG